MALRIEDELHADIRKLMAAPFDFTAFRALAQDAYDTYLEPHLGYPAACIVRLMEVAVRVQYEANQMAQTDAIRQAVYDFIRMMASLLAMDISMPLADVTRLLPGAARRVYPDVDEQIIRWIDGKLRFLLLYLEIRWGAEAWIKEAMKGLRIGQLLRENHWTIDDLHNASSRLMQVILAVRRYGVKDTYWQDDLFHKNGQAWLFMDPNDIREYGQQLDSLWSYHDAVALILLASDVRQLTERPELAFGIDTANRSGSLMLGIDVEIGFELTVAGNLELSGGMATMPLERLCRRYGASDFYEVLHLVQVLRLFDLSIPIEVHTRGQLPALAPTFGKETKHARLRRMLNPSILLPRLLQTERLLEIERQLEGERAASERAARQAHEVTHYIRPLPAGYHPSKTARERCYREMNGRVLADNETYVRKHRRGEGELNGIHEAKQRPSP